MTAPADVPRPATRRVREHIGSQAALDELLDRVASLPRPTWVGLVSADELATMNIGVGAAFSSLTFYDDVDGSAKYRSAGTLVEPQVATFDYDGVPTTMGKGSAISQPPLLTDCQASNSTDA
jgi:hypothetical protein